MRFIDFLWIAATIILCIQLIAALLGLLMAAWWLEYLDKAPKEKAVPLGIPPGQKILTGGREEAQDNAEV